MSQRLVRNGHRVVGYARHAETVDAFKADGSISAGATSLEDLVTQLPAPRILWLMIPAGVGRCDAWPSSCRCWPRAT